MSKYTATASLSVTNDVQKPCGESISSCGGRKRGVQDSSLLYKGTLPVWTPGVLTAWAVGRSAQERQLLRQPGSHQPVGRWYGYLRSQGKKKKDLVSSHNPCLPRMMDLTQSCHFLGAHSLLAPKLTKDGAKESRPKTSLTCHHPGLHSTPPTHESGSHLEACGLSAFPPDGHKAESFVFFSLSLNVIL